MPSLVGQNLGRYHIVAQLGEGGMATVYKAFDTRLERDVALKIIRTDMGQSDEMLKRFEREARALAQLTHPNIVHINDFGEQGGMPYVVMDYLPGGTLKDKLGVPMPYGDAARLLACIARALDYAHQRKIIHRDVKPANILLSQSGEPLLSDFGIAKIMEGDLHTQLTATGVGLGTPDYMAPEQWMGNAEARTDIYALGIVFYELVTGRRPYTADTPAAILLKHVNDPLPDPRQYVPALPEAVCQVIFRALAKQLEDRYPTMREFAAALERLAAEKVLSGAALSTAIGATAQQTVLASATRAGATVAPLKAPTHRLPAGSPAPILSQPPPPAAASRPQAGVSRTLAAAGLGGLVVLCLLAAGALGFWALSGRLFGAAPLVAASPTPTTAASPTVEAPALTTPPPTNTPLPPSPTLAPTDTPVPTNTLVPTSLTPTPFPQPTAPATKRAVPTPAAPTQAASGKAVIVLHNQGQVPIAHIILGSAAWGGWGGDQTGDIIPPGGTFTVAPGPGAGVYDLRAEDANHVVLSLQMGVSINGTYDWFVGP